MDKFLKKRTVPLDRDDGAKENISNGKDNQKSIYNSLSKDMVGSLEDVNKLLALAKLRNVKGEIQQVVLSSPFTSDDFRLLEVNSKIADEIEAGTIEFVFRGQLDDLPVICTKSKTYVVKEAETSNTLLLLPELRFSNEVIMEERFLKKVEVKSMQMRYLELNEVKMVSLNRLKELLHENELEWTKSENLAEDGKKLYTFSDLLNVIQMSENELKDALAHLPVIEYNGHLRQLSSEFRDRLLMELIELLDDDNEPDISVSSVSIPTFYKALKRREPERLMPMDAVKWLIRSHCFVSSKEGVETYTIDERAICRSKASQLLRAAVRFELSTFETLMKQLLPEGVELKNEYLEGLGLIDEELTRGKTIRYLNVEDLPEDEAERLDLLFSLRSPWKYDELRPFLSDICATPRELNELLARKCRMATINNERILLSLK